MKIRFLGTYNAESVNTKLVSFLIDEDLAVDAGSLASALTFAEQANIRAILLSHAHYDHIKEIPTFAFNNTAHITRIFSTLQVLDVLSSHLFDGLIYPDFTSKASFLGRATLKLVPLEPYRVRRIGDHKVTAIPVNHSVHAVGFQVASKDGKQIFYTGDTGAGLSEVWKIVDPQLLIIELTVPDKLTSMALESGHLCPRTLWKELNDFRLIKGYLPEIVVVHLSPQYEEEISEEVKRVANDLNISISVAREGQTIII